jgi:hypothetical protein
MTQKRNPAVGSGGAVAVEINASGNAVSTTTAPENQLAVRVLARRHCLRPNIARLMVDLGASGARLAA